MSNHKVTNHTNLNSYKNIPVASKNESCLNVDIASFFVHICIFLSCIFWYKIVAKTTVLNPYYYSEIFLNKLQVEDCTFDQKAGFSMHFHCPLNVSICSVFPLVKEEEEVKKKCAKKGAICHSIQSLSSWICSENSSCTELSEDIDVEFMALPASILQNCLVNVFPY